MDQRPQDLRSIVARDVSETYNDYPDVSYIWGRYKLDTFEINTECSSWFHHNVKVEENKKRTLFSSHEYHLYKGKKVIGYICGGEEPR